MGDTHCTWGTERLAREIECEANRIERYCDYVITSLDYEPDAIGSDFGELVDSCREIGAMMVQLRRSAQPQAPTAGAMAGTVQQGLV